MIQSTLKPRDQQTMSKSVTFFSSLQPKLFKIFSYNWVSVTKFDEQSNVHEDICFVSLEMLIKKQVKCTELKYHTCCFHYWY